MSGKPKDWCKWCGADVPRRHSYCLTGDCVSEALADAIKRKSQGVREKHLLQWLLQKRKAKEANA